jgi:hypothetical protein
MSGTVTEPVEIVIDLPPPPSTNRLPASDHVQSRRKAMTKTTLIIQRDLKAEADFDAFNDQVEKITNPFGAMWIGCGTFMPTGTRDWQYEVDISSAHVVAEKLRDAGYSVEILNPALATVDDDLKKEKHAVSNDEMTTVFYLAPGAPGTTPEHEKMLRAHDDEAAGYAAEFRNYGCEIDAYSIASKTTRGILHTLIDPKTMKVEHSWQRR